MRSEVAKYVKKKSSLYAANGGKVPDVDDEDDEESDDEADSPDDAPDAEKAPDAEPASKPAVPADVPDVSAQKVAPVSDADAKTQAIQDYLMKKFGQANDDSGIKAAMADQEHKNQVANFTQGLMTFAGARGVANGAAPDDGKLAQGIREQGKLGVEHAMKLRDQNVQNFLQSNEIKRQVSQDQMAKGTWENQQTAAKWEKDRHDPASPYSNSMRDQFQNLWGDKIGDADLTNVSAAQMDDMAKQYESRAKIDEAKAAAELKAATIRAGREATAENKRQFNTQRTDAASLKTANNDLSKLKDDLDAEKSNSRNGIGQAANKVNSANRLMTFADVKAEDLERAKKDPDYATKLVAKLDKLSPQKKAEMVQGLMGQISNGGGSLGQFEHLNAATAGETIANLKQFFTSHPEAANAGPMLLDNLMTLKNEREASQKVIDDHNTAMHAAHPHAFAHPDTKTLAENMYKAFVKPPDAAKPEPEKAPVGGDGQAVAAPALPPVDALEAEMKRRGLIKAAPAPGGGAPAGVGAPPPGGG